MPQKWFWSGSQMHSWQWLCTFYDYKWRFVSFWCRFPDSLAAPCFIDEPPVSLTVSTPNNFYNHLRLTPLVHVLDCFPSHLLNSSTPAILSSFTIIVKSPLCNGFPSNAAGQNIIIVSSLKSRDGMLVGLVRIGLCMPLGCWVHWYSIMSCPAHSFSQHSCLPFSSCVLSDSSPVMFPGPGKRWYRCPRWIPSILKLRPVRLLYVWSDPDYDDHRPLWLHFLKCCSPAIYVTLSTYIRPLGSNFCDDLYFWVIFWGSSLALF